AAFDAIQDAFETLASPNARNTYDSSLSKLKRARRWTPRRLRKWSLDWCQNLLSSALLLRHQLKSGGGVGAAGAVAGVMGAVRQGLAGRLAGVSASGGRLIEHLALLPSFADRLALLHEKIRKAPWWVTPVLMAVTML
ncbi:hypothetical protein B484DRAFT_406906, partial [Ochromonadaceae sp. CCMP2298]